MPPPILSLDPYTGSWTKTEAAHLLRRTTYSYDKDQIQQLATDGLVAALDTLLEIKDLPNPPLNFGFIDSVSEGETWINNPVNLLNLQNRLQSLAGWTIEQMLETPLNIREKMVLFWHNHFAIGGINEPAFLYKYSNTLRTYTLGNFRELTKAITIDPLMLRYLNGNQNSVDAPNENYARELLELFTIGKGPIAGPGDYTNYTEQDIAEIARILTGWIDVGYQGSFGLLPDVVFFQNRHDTGQKQLSERFDNELITNMGDNEYAHLIDIIFQKLETARFICRKLYRWFVYHKIDEDIEQQIIEPLAQQLYDDDYEILPILKVLLSSEHFYDSEMSGCLIKNPYEHILPMFSVFELPASTTLNSQYQKNIVVFGAATLMEMTYYNIPQVAGWKAYYQTPVYNRYWINNVTLTLRSTVVDVALITGFNAGGENVKIDLFKLVDQLPNPRSADNLIVDSAKLLFTHSLTQDQIDNLREALIPGLPPFEWTVEYDAYLADPTNPITKTVVNLRLLALFRAMLNMAEYQLF
jgi:hypothetical protein